MPVVERGIELLRAEITNTKPSENVNYKEIWPATTIDAVHEAMDLNSKSLQDILDEIYQSLAYKQKIFPAKSSNYLVQYGGIEGAIGAVPMTHTIDVDPDLWSDDKIPTEKAVGMLLTKYGVFDGTISEKLLWKNIINRPTIYSELGNDDFGLISQSGLSNIINSLADRLDNDINDLNTNLSNTSDILNDHINNSANPHNLIPSSIGAASQEDFDSHINDFDNPHFVTKEQIGLGNVNNTSDMNKPISIATQNELDKINRILRDLGINVENFKYVVDLQYDVLSGKLIFVFNDNTTESTIIGTGELIDEVKFDQETHVMTFIEVSGRKINIDLSSLYVEGYTSDTVDIDIGENGELIGNIINKAISSIHIKDKGITAINLGDESVTERAIKNFSVTSDKLAEGSVTSGKIFSESIREGHISSRAVTGNKLFSSNQDKSFLFVNQHGTDPVWSPISSDMLLDDLIETRHLIDKSVTSEKLSDDIDLIGRPTVNGIPIADHDYVEDLIHQSVLNNINLADRSVDGRVLFSSNIKNRILGVYETNQDPVWGKVNHEMLDDNSVGSNNIIDKTVTESKFADDSVSARVIDNDSILPRHLKESSVTSEKIYKANEADMVLASDSTLHPVYSKVTENMLALESVNTQNIKNQSVTLDKIQHSDDSYSVLATDYMSTDPKWTKVSSQMISESAVTKDKIYPANNDNVVLAAHNRNDHPEYMKINSDMVEDEFLQDRHIPTGSIKRYHLDPEIFEVPETEIIPDSELVQMKRTWFHDGSKSMILTIGNDDNDIPRWKKLTSDFIKDNGIDLDRLQKSEFPNRIIGVKNDTDNPQFLLLQNDMIEDQQISSSKLLPDLILFGSPHLEEHPDKFSNDGTIADTKWVNERINEITGIDKIDINVDKVEDHSIPLSKLEITEDKPKVLGIKNNDVEFTTISEEMIDNSAVTTNKLQRDINLLGSPTLDVRPSPESSDELGTGNEIVDSQWVNDKLVRNGAEFYEKLQAKICCLQPPDPEKIDANHLRIQRITEEDLNKILNDEINPAPNSPTFVDYSNKIGPIQYDQIKGIILGEIEPLPSKHYTDDNLETTFVSIDENKLIRILNNEEEPEEADNNYYDIYNGYRDNECMCFGNKDYSFITSIKEETILELMNGISIPLTPDNIIYKDNVFSSISRQLIHDIINDDELNIDYMEDVLINNQVITPIKEERLYDILLNNFESEFTKAADVTLYETYEKVFEGYPLMDNSVITSFIQDRAITSRKLFTSIEDNMVLAVIDANSDPVYTKVTHDMVDDWIIKTKFIESSNTDNVILGVINANDEPLWMKINHNMLENNSVHTNNLLDESVTNDKILNHTIRENKLAQEEMIKEIHIYDNSITERKIKDRNITGSKIARDQTIPSYTKVEEHTNYERRSLRNTIISAHNPEEFCMGDIWFQL